MKDINKDISIIIVSRNRYKSIKKLLKILSLSSTKLKNKPIVIIGTEFGQYKKINNFKNLIIKKEYFKKNTHPTEIKNNIYIKLKSNIKIFLDDDILIKKDFLTKILNFSKKNKNCYLKTIPVSFFSNKNFFSFFKKYFLGKLNKTSLS